MVGDPNGFDHRYRLALAVDTGPQERPQVIGRPGLRGAQVVTRQGRGPARPAMAGSLPVSATARASGKAQGQAKAHRTGT